MAVSPVKLQAQTTAMASVSTLDNTAQNSLSLQEVCLASKRIVETSAQPEDDQLLRKNTRSDTSDLAPGSSQTGYCLLQPWSSMLTFGSSPPSHSDCFTEHRLIVVPVSSASLTGRLSFRKVLVEPKDYLVKHACGC